MERYKITVHNPCREGRKLLVLDFDYTLLNPSATAESPLGLTRPYLHEFLSAVYAEYDIIIWSASSMKRIEFLLGELGVLNNRNYKITTVLDDLATIRIQSHPPGLSITCKPLDLIWANFLEFYSPKNTIMIDDCWLNLLMNPQNGLTIKPFRKTHSSRRIDRQLNKLTEYLLAIAPLHDLSCLDHNNWKSNKDYIQRLRHGKSKQM